MSFRKECKKVRNIHKKKMSVRLDEYLWKEQRKYCLNNNTNFSETTRELWKILFDVEKYVKTRDENE